MPTPFPGMDPYLERRERRHAVHTHLIVAIANALGPQVRPRYRVDIELRTYVALLTSTSPVGVPDVLVMSSPQASDPGALPGRSPRIGPQPVEVPMPQEVHERYLVVREVATEEVITVVEILSLANKLTGEGREAYEAKRAEVLGSQTHLFEFDLLRAGRPLPPFQPGQSHYRILISRSQTRPQGDAYRFDVRDPIPEIPVPLRPDDPEPMLPLNQLLHDIYDRAGYDLAIDYDQPPPPPDLTSDETAWLRETLQAGGVP